VIRPAGITDIVVLEAAAFPDWGDSVGCCPLKKLLRLFISGERVNRQDFQAFSEA
jgi:hypothetical protein